jgi:hypothetical protein
LLPSILKAIIGPSQKRIRWHQRASEPCWRWKSRWWWFGRPKKKRRDKFEPCMNFTAEMLLNRIDLPLKWPVQLKALGVN